MASLMGGGVTVIFTKPGNNPPIPIVIIGSTRVSTVLTVASLASSGCKVTSPSSKSSKVRVEGSFVVHAGSPLSLIADAGYTGTLPPAAPPLNKFIVNS